MPNFQIFKYLRIAALFLFILDFVLNIISSYGLGLANLFIPTLLQAAVITYLTRYIFYGLIVIYFVIMTFILLRNRFHKGDDSQIFR